uniref:Uncharacterized protein n=1 Tax=Timema poppense TaxID=170557 RepID=A0A7R9CNH6_TIMPO|nr:unnamed protein product [Timema poppensis]
MTAKVHLFLVLNGGLSVSHLLTFFPGDPQVPSSKEAGHGVTGKVVDPSLLSQLRHDRVNEGVPRLQIFGVGVPRYLTANRVTHHLVKIRGPGGDNIVELSPHQLANQRHGAWVSPPGKRQGASWPSSTPSSSRVGTTRVLSPGAHLEGRQACGRSLGVATGHTGGPKLSNTLSIFWYGISRNMGGVTGDLAGFRSKEGIWRAFIPTSVDMKNSRVGRRDSMLSLGVGFQAPALHPPKNLQTFKT